MPATAVPAAPRSSPRAVTVDECPSCGTRFLGAQRCAECNVFCRRVGLGGPCPHCDEPVAVVDLISHPATARDNGNGNGR